jgi:tetratricopeptide (TPR) repeat protein
MTQRASSSSRASKLPDLRDPVGYRRWVEKQVQSGRTRLEIAQMLEAEGSVVGMMRAAHNYAIAGDYDRHLQLSGMGLLSEDCVVRGHAHALLAMHELNTYEEGKHIASNGASLTLTLEKALEMTQQVLPKTLFGLETEVMLMSFLCDLYSNTRTYERALELSSEAILVSKWLGVPSLNHNARLAYALASVRLERLDDALGQYELIAQAEHVKPMHKLLANVNQALLLLRFGDDDRARALLQDLFELHSNNEMIASSLQYAEAIGGLITDDEHVITCTSGNFDMHVRALQLVDANSGRPCESDLRAVLALLRGWQPNSVTLIPMTCWLQGLALLRLGQPLLATQRIMGIASGMPDIHLMILGLKLEIALHHASTDVSTIPSLCADLRQIILNASNQHSRLGLARRLAFWHPLVAAFLAACPESTDEVVDVALGSVFQDGRPISVHGFLVQSRLPFIQITLEAFGIDSRLPRDQHAEKERMKSALLVPHGRRNRWLPVVSPAFLIYNLLRVAEGHGELWRAFALELARTHGLVPKTLGGCLRPEREGLQRALEDMLYGKLTSMGFRARVTTLVGGGNNND